MGRSWMGWLFFGVAVLVLAWVGLAQADQQSRVNDYYGHGDEVQLETGSQGFGLTSKYYEFTLGPRVLKRHPSKGSGSVRLGGVDLNGYCLSHGYDNAALSSSRTGPGAAYNNWVCATGQTHSSPIDMGAACEHSYAQRPVLARPTNPDDAYTWNCYQPNNASDITISSMTVNSRAHRLYVGLLVSGYPKVTLTATLPSTSMTFLDHGAVYLTLRADLKNVFGSTKAGSIRLSFPGRIAGRSLRFVPIVHLDIAAGVIPATKGPYTAEIPYLPIKLPLIKREIKRPTRDATYRGRTNYKKSIQLKTGLGGSIIKKIKLTYPAHECKGAAFPTSSTSGTDTNFTLAPIAGNGAFLFVVDGVERYTSGEVAGLYTIQVAGKFTKVKGLYNVSGVYLLTEYVLVGPGRGATCLNGGGFTAAG